ncbi:Serine/threonine-protein kinase oca2 [Smittium culicis]|uniref:Serine/threonine-protein kinase oca2 n=1 Tax=Smittium culicis TaxID=133412 RepID=A0A1R1X3F8_9FUNG|nr:Serine/threonine-protein kinase oca2 [Smittium culicis]
MKINRLFSYNNNSNHVSPTVTLYDDKRSHTDFYLQKALNSMRTIFKSDFLPKKCKKKGLQTEAKYSRKRTTAAIASALPLAPPTSSRKYPGSAAHSRKNSNATSSYKEPIFSSAATTKTANSAISVVNDDSNIYNPSKPSSTVDLLYSIVQKTSSARLLSRFGPSAKLLGSGADGSVNLHIDQSGHKYAIKTFKLPSAHKSSPTDNIIDSRTANEILINSKIDHPNVVKALACYIESSPSDAKNNVHLVMEYCDRDLFSLVMELQDNLADPASQAAMPSPNLFNSIFVQLINTVDFLHTTQKIAHRDIKLDNICLDANLNVKIADFGCAVDLNSNHLVSGLCGSDPYIGPEVFAPSPYDPTKVDVWSLAIVYLAMVSGRFPWEISKPSDKNFAYFLNMPEKFVDYWLNSSSIPATSSSSSSQSDLNSHKALAKDMILSMLNTDPAKRPSLAQLKSHPFYLLLLNSSH